VAWQARSTLIDLALPGPFALIVTIAPIGALAIYGRILLIGSARPGPAVREGRGERPRWPDLVSRRPIVGRGGFERFERFERVSHAVGGGLDVAWVVPAAIRTNRMPLAAIAVFLLSGLAFVVAGGGLGVTDAARAVPVVGGSEPGPAGAPPPSGAPSASITPSASVGPSASFAAPASAGPEASVEPGASGSQSSEPSFAPVP
jgi:hypothetical protein